MRLAAAAVAALGAAVFVSHVSPAGAQEPTPPPGTARSPAPAGAASVRGRVTDQATGQPVASAQVAVLPSAGGRLGGLTDNSGEFTVTGVPAGQATVRVLRIGYAPVTQTVAVPATGQVTLTFALTRAVAQLEAVVTTATGLQSRREVGNAIATIRADSIAGEAPLTSVTDLLQARTSGVQVVQGSGATGAAPSIRIRGTSSLSLTNEPLIIVDGVRVDNSAQPTGPNNSGVVTQRINRFGAFNPDDIESLDIIKGPSAAALYGTAAANGVLVIKTKRGVAGRPRWSVYGESGRVSQPANFFDNYRAWGRNVTNNTPGTTAVLCRISDQALGRCLRDSLTTFNPLMNSETTPFAAEPRYLAGAQVSGGSERFTYFAAGELEDETGPFRMPAAEVRRLTTARGTAPRDEQVNPNQLRQLGGRGNFNVPIGRNATIAFSNSYTDRTLYTPFEGSFFAGLWNQTYFAPGFRTTTGGTSAQNIGDIFSVTQRLRDQRYVGSAAANWQPIGWLETRATAGLDQNQGYGYRFSRFGEGTVTGWGPPGQTGGKDVTRNNYSRYSVDLGATATWQARPALSTRTSLGAQWFKDTQYETSARGYSLPPGATTPNGATQQLGQELTNENATYGAFVEEQLGWADRRFLTLRLRTDQNSAFGANAGNVVYPGAALSWVISDEGWFPAAAIRASNVRLRAAYGQAGQFPTVTTASLQFLNAFSVPVGGVETAALRLQSLGNTELKPEVTTEVELGADAAFFGGRVNLEATVFEKQSRDALFNNPLPPSFGTSQVGAPTQWQNLGAVQNRGVELAIDGQLVRTRLFSWTARLNGSLLRNKLVTAGNAQLAVTQGARNVVGYPLFALWARPIRSYADANGDGILVESEVVVGDTAEYKGPTLPTREGGISNTLGFFNDRLRVAALLDYRGGFYNQWGFENQRCVSGNCRAVNDPSAPLDEQAAAVATTSAKYGNTVWGFFRPNDFVRFRELSVTGSVPERYVQRVLRGRTASVTFSGRNIGVLWTRFPGIDPETNWQVANTGGGNSDQYASPPLRYWLLRVNLGL
jgi:TonB-linked SusC/RagA family outer membrane protein